MTSNYCQVCGAQQGEPHQDDAKLIVQLAEHAGRNGISRMLCQICLQGQQESELEASGTPEGLLVKATRLQHEFWDALRELELALDIEIDSNNDLEGETVESLMEGAEEEEEETEDEDDDEKEQD